MTYRQFSSITSYRDWRHRYSRSIIDHGVRFAVRRTLLKMVKPGGKGLEWRLPPRLYTFAGLITLISAYAPTLTLKPETRDKFYTNLNDVIKNIHISNHLLLGDFNARVSEDHDSWSSCLGSFGVGKKNENRQRLLELWSYHGLCVTNSYFQTDPQQRVSWRHAWSKHWHLLDMVIVRRTSLKHMILTRSYHSSDCDSNCSQECCKIKLLPRKLQRSKHVGKPRSDTQIHKAS